MSVYPDRGRCAAKCDGDCGTVLHAATLSKLIKRMRKKTWESIMLLPEGVQPRSAAASAFIEQLQLATLPDGDSFAIAPEVRHYCKKCFPKNNKIIPDPSLH